MVPESFVIQEGSILHRNRKKKIPTKQTRPPSAWNVCIIRSRLQLLQPRWCKEHAGYADRILSIFGHAMVEALQCREGYLLGRNICAFAPHSHHGHPYGSSSTHLSLHKRQRFLGPLGCTSQRHSQAVGTNYCFGDVSITLILRRRILNHHSTQNWNSMGGIAALQTTLMQCVIVANGNYSSLFLPSPHSLDQWISACCASGQDEYRIVYQSKCHTCRFQSICHGCRKLQKS